MGLKKANEIYFPLPCNVNFQIDQVKKYSHGIMADFTEQTILKQNKQY